MTDDNLDKSLEELGFSTLSEDEEEEVRQSVPNTTGEQDATAVPEPVSDVELARIRAQIIEVLDALPPPIETGVWETEISDMQSQLRTCLINEIVDRYVFGEKHHIFRVINRSIDEEDIDAALLFPVTLAMIVYNTFDETRIIPEKQQPTLADITVDDEALGKQAFSALVEQLNDMDEFTCPMIHPYLNGCLDDVDIENLHPLLTSRQIAEAKVLAREVLLRVYALSLPHVFRRRVRNGDIMRMVSTVVSLTFITNKVVAAALDED